MLKGGCEKIKNMAILSNFNEGVEEGDACVNGI